MKSNRFESVKRVFLMALGALILADGASAEVSNPKHRPGLIVVAKVSGTVEATDPQAKTTYQLKKSDTISEKYTVNVGASSSATLAFSNGAIINLLENTTLVISEFLQDPFSSPFASSELSQEPTTSVTKLQLVKGQMVGTVKKLRTDQGSSLTVLTPVGAAGVRGTTLAVSYVPDASGKGKGSYTLSVTEGEVEFTDTNGKKRTVKAGMEVVITVQTGSDGQITIVSMEIQYIPRNRSNMITKVAQDGALLSETLFNDVLDKAQADGLQKLINEQNIVTKPTKPKRKPPVTQADPN